MKIIGGEERLKQIQDEEEDHVCPGCGGSGYGEIFTDPLGGIFVAPCSDCGGWGDDELWKQFLDEIDL